MMQLGNSFCSKEVSHKDSMLFNSQAENELQGFPQNNNALLWKAAILWHFRDAVVAQCPS